MLHFYSVSEETSILYAEIKLHSDTNQIITTPIDPNIDPNNQGIEPTRWTNNRIRIVKTFSALYLQVGYTEQKMSLEV
jgi:hypothetical protein